MTLTSTSERASGPGAGNRAIAVMKLALVVGIGLTVTVVLAACGGDGGAETVAARPAGVTAEQPQAPDERAGDDASAVQDASPEARALPPETDSTAPLQLSPEMIFSEVSPSIAFIETPSGTGSGILIGDGQIVTNAHVVWPFDHVRVFFPNGEDFPTARVTGLDLMADIATIEVSPSAELQPLAIGSPDELAIGSQLLLIGYPGETELNPRPTITTGVLSRFRRWEDLDLTYVQTDAAIAGGQSGGALVSPTGEVVGMSTFAFAGGTFALSTSMPDVLRRVQDLDRGVDVAELGDRRFRLGESGTAITVELAHYFDQRTFVLEASPGSTTTVSVESLNDAWIAVDLVGGFNVATVDETTSGTEQIEVLVEFAEPYLITIGQNSVSPAEIALTSDRPLAALRDPDDGLLLRPGTVVRGNLEHPWDVDYFFIDLAAGQELTATVDTANFDPIAVIDLPSNVSETFLAADDDSGGGLFGLNARVAYTVSAPGRYVLTVEDVEKLSNGGYILTIEVESQRAGPSRPSGERIRVFDLRAGDCFNTQNRPLLISGDVYRVHVTSCAGEWQAQVLDIFTVSLTGSYPAEAYFDEQVLEHCATGTTFWLIPTVESWSAGDRAVTCILEADAFFAPEPGQCVATGDLGGVLPEDVVTCSNPHFAEVFHTFDHPGSSYPGDAAMRDLATRECLSAFNGYVGIDYENSVFYEYDLSPTAATWKLAGDRTIVCYLGSDNLDELLVGGARGSNR